MKKITCVSLAGILVTLLLLLSMTSMRSGRSSDTDNEPVAVGDSSGIMRVKNQGGPTLGYSTGLGVKILTVNGLSLAGHTYDFGYGLNWKGVIRDARTARYVNQIEKPVIKMNGNKASITSATAGSKIYYTVDGRTPSFTSADAYSKPFDLKPGATIKAIAKVEGVNNSVLVVFRKE